MITILSAGCTANSENLNTTAPIENQGEQEGSGVDQNVTQNESLVQLEEQGQNTVSEGKLSKQENDKMINDILNSLSELEDTVNSLDDVSDSELQILN